ncbi:hypothetical protein EV714DRAFT_278146 [Schizophyllum commune]
MSPAAEIQEFFERLKLAGPPSRNAGSTQSVFQPPPRQRIPPGYRPPIIRGLQRPPEGGASVEALHQPRRQHAEQSSQGISAASTSTTSFDRPTSPSHAIHAPPVPEEMMPQPDGPRAEDLEEAGLDLLAAVALNPDEDSTPSRQKAEPSSPVSALDDAEGDTKSETGQNQRMRAALSSFFANPRHSNNANACSVLCSKLKIRNRSCALYKLWKLFAPMSDENSSTSSS